MHTPIRVAYSLASLTQAMIAKNAEHQANQTTRRTVGLCKEIQAVT